MHSSGLSVSLVTSVSPQRPDSSVPAIGNGPGEGVRPRPLHAGAQAKGQRGPLPGLSGEAAAQGVSAHASSAPHPALRRCSLQGGSRIQSCVVGTLRANRPLLCRIGEDPWCVHLQGPSPPRRRPVARRVRTRQPEPAHRYKAAVRLRGGLGDQAAGQGDLPQCTPLTRSFGDPLPNIFPSKKPPVRGAVTQEPQQPVGLKPTAPLLLLLLLLTPAMPTSPEHLSPQPAAPTPIFEPPAAGG